MSSIPSYKYEPIGHSTIRLLELLDSDSEISCSLAEYSIDNPPAYYALSYVWGTEDPSHHVTCNGKPLPVTSHLLSGLQALKQATAVKMFWIDAICINQQDDIEKAVQVPMMSRIYPAAEKVIIWLGPSQDDSDLAMRDILRLNELFDAVESTVALDRHTLSSHGLPGLEQPIWPAIMHLLFRDWFWRLWVFQEAVMAEAIQVICGSSLMEWEHLVLCTNHIRAARFMDDILSYHKIRPNIPDHGFSAIPLIDILRDMGSQGKSMNIIPLLQIARRKLVTEPIDRIYGLLGIMSEELRERISVDYSHTSKTEFWKAYINLSKMLLEIDGFLLLDMTPSVDRRSEFPSWCPDFNVRGCVNTLGRLYKAGRFDIDDHRKHTQAVITIPESPEVKFNGLELDRIEHVLPFSWKAIDNIQASTVAAKLLIETEAACAKLSKKVYDSLDEVPVQHMVTLVTGMHVERTEYPVDQLKEDYHNAISWVRDLSITEILHQQRTFPSNDQPRLISAQRYIGAMNIAWEGTCFFSTEKGHIGIGSSAIRAGDSVCVFFTAYTPHVLRYDAERSLFEFVGSAYVHGLMDGTAFREADPVNHYCTFVVG